MMEGWGGDDFDAPPSDELIPNGGWPHEPPTIGTNRTISAERQCAWLRLRVAALEATVTELNAWRLASGMDARQGGNEVPCEARQPGGEAETPITSPSSPSIELDR